METKTLYTPGDMVLVYNMEQQTLEWPTRCTISDVPLSVWGHLCKAHREGRFGAMHSLFVVLTRECPTEFPF
jgi:hypothetical protein